MKESRYKNNNIIISDSTLQNILPPQIKNMIYRYKVMCGCECCISSKIIHSSLLSWCDRFFEKLKYHICNTQNRRSGATANCLFGAYKNTVMLHGNNMLKIHQVFLYIISGNMATLVNTDKYGAIHTTDTTAMATM